MPTPSPRAIAMIENFENGGVYNEHPNWPGGSSGVTIGTGYDLGYETKGQFFADWGACLDRGALYSLADVCGLKGGMARLALGPVLHVVVPENAANQVFYNQDVARYSAITAAAFANCADLSEDSFGALVSLVFNRGAGMNDASGDGDHRRLEMREVRDAMATKMFDKVPVFIRAMKRLWPEGAGLDGLRTRRDAEANLFEEGLAGGVVAGATESDADNLNDAELAKMGIPPA